MAMAESLSRFLYVCCFFTLLLGFSWCARSRINIDHFDPPTSDRFPSFAFSDNKNGYKTSQWSCIILQQVELKQSGSGVFWTKYNCTGRGPSAVAGRWSVGPIIINVIDANLTRAGVFVQPAVADPSSPYQLQTIPEMSNRVVNAVAGVNGGYFWRLDDSSFIDDVCFGKTRKDAEQPVSLTFPNYGIGDGLTIVNGTVLSSNCDLPGYNVPVALIADGASSQIVIMSKGQRLPNTVANAIAAGPNLVSYNSTSKSSFVDIPQDDYNVNIWGHGADTAIGLVLNKESSSSSLSSSSSKTLLMVTVDGHNGCHIKDATCGIFPRPLGFFMKDYLGATTAMAMDRGGSTTMWVAGQPNDGVVSNSDNNNPSASPRSLFNGLFVGVM